MILTCVPVGHAPRDYPDYPKKPCPECEMPMFVGPRIAKLAAESGVEPICMLCLVKRPDYTDRAVRHLGGP